MTNLKATRRLSAIVMADIVGYSLLMNEDEIGTLKVIKNIQSELINPLVNLHAGRVVKTMGDGFLIEFASVIEATQCSIEIQKSIIKRDVKNKGKTKVSLRIGIHMGCLLYTSPSPRD